jgi:DNA-binding GntR family transcriptional regulator
MEADVEKIDRLAEPRGTTEQVAQRIRDAIASGGILPGAWLREAPLASRFGVSRIPVREALGRLEAEGLVKRVPYRGTIVVRLTMEQVIESFTLRSLLEGFATKLATPHLTPDELERLRTLVNLLEEYGRTGHHEDVAPLHREFHTTIYERCSSPTLMRWINELYNQFPKSLRQSTRVIEPPLECRGIVEAIAAGDADRAGRLMSEHIDHGAAVAVKRYSEILAPGEGEKIISSGTH